MGQLNNGFTIESHFTGKAPIVRAIYDQVLQRLARYGAIIEDPKKTSIHLVAKTALVGVATRKDYLILTLKSARALKSPRIHKSERTSANRFHHELKLKTPAEVDDELFAWLKEAYDLSV